MIKVPRPVPAPDAVAGALLKPLRSGQTEIEAARIYYNSVPTPAKAYNFSKYKVFEVCNELDKLFYGKCAYCESPYRAVDALDIEHFRPKGGIAEAADHPGYWWLASDWANLLPSCPACNQRRRQVVYRLGITAEQFERELELKPSAVVGKGCSFLVRGKNWVSAEGGDLLLEDPLLINPCDRDPEEHIKWIFDRASDQSIWEADPVYPFACAKSTDGNSEDEYAKASIAVYGLNRAGVIRERAAHVKRMQLLSVPLIDAFADLARHEDPEGGVAGPTRDRLARYKRNLVAYTKPDQPYSGMAKAYLRELEDGLSKLGAN